MTMRLQSTAKEGLLDCKALKRSLEDVMFKTNKNEKFQSKRLKVSTYIFNIFRGPEEKFCYYCFKKRSLADLGEARGCSSNTVVNDKPLA